MIDARGLEINLKSSLKAGIGISYKDKSWLKNTENLKQLCELSRALIDKVALELILEGLEAH